jgi:hypothetical protein
MSTEELALGGMGAKFPACKELYNPAREDLLKLIKAGKSHSELAQNIDDIVAMLLPLNAKYSVLARVVLNQFAARNVAVLGAAQAAKAAKKAARAAK